MKKTLLFTLILAITSFSLNAQTLYGEIFSDKESITTEELLQKLEKKTPIQNVIVRGEIAEVCQAEGCWVKLKNPGSPDVMVKFKDHAFVVPKNIAGKQMVVFGTASMKKVSVAEQKHLAQDAGKSKKEIAKIKKDKIEARIEAVGATVE
jgi:hypothetical protein